MRDNAIAPYFRIDFCNEQIIGLDGILLLSLYVPSTQHISLFYALRM